MLKDFKEQNDDYALKQISNVIDRVVDTWVNELLAKMVASPMDPSTKRDLWDRFKGTLANIWYGGKYNPKNPYYAQHRFGDELGASVKKTENFNPSAFTLKEYNELKSIIDRFEEAINEQQQLPTWAEKIKLVKIIKDEAAKLKKELKNIFTRNCKTAEKQPSGKQDRPIKKPISSQAAPLNDLTPTPREGDPVEEPKDKPVAAVEEPVAAVEEPNDIQGDRDNGLQSVSDPDSLSDDDESQFNFKKNIYQRMIPKEENQGKTIKKLKEEKQYVDEILHPDYVPDKDKISIKIGRLEELKEDASARNESPKIISKIDKAIEKIKSFK
jgi:hypothetical protein